MTSTLSLLLDDPALSEAQKKMLRLHLQQSRHMQHQLSVWEEPAPSVLGLTPPSAAEAAAAADADADIADADAADAAADAAAAAGGGADGGGGLDVTLDVITSTHRVWLGTGGFAECPEALY